jgi:hypothetical protein
VTRIALTKHVSSLRDIASEISNEIFVVDDHLLGKVIIQQNAEGSSAGWLEPLREEDPRVTIK